MSHFNSAEELQGKGKEGLPFVQKLCAREQVLLITPAVQYVRPQVHGATQAGTRLAVHTAAYTMRTSALAA